MSPIRCFEFALAISGAVATTLTLLGIPGSFTVLTAAVVLAVLAPGLLLQQTLSLRFAKFRPGAALHGSGYVPEFRVARKSLLLMHLDDDAPGPQLVGLYSELLERGIQIRRLVVGKRGAAHSWKQIEHPSLQQRSAFEGHDAILPLSFAVVDESVVLLALPGYAPTETVSLSDRLVLRHLVKLTHPEVVRAFVEAYEVSWEATRTAG